MRYFNEFEVEGKHVILAFSVIALSHQALHCRKQVSNQHIVCACPNSIISLERIHQYLVIDHEPKPVPEGIPPASWPTSGDLVVENLSARYSMVSFS